MTLNKRLNKPPGSKKRGVNLFMKDNGFERGLAEQLMQELMEAQKAKGSTATLSVVERHDGVYVQKENWDGEVVLYPVQSTVQSGDENKPA